MTHFIKKKCYYLTLLSSESHKYSGKLERKNYYSIIKKRIYDLKSNKRM